MSFLWVFAALLVLVALLAALALLIPRVFGSKSSTTASTSAVRSDAPASAAPATTEPEAPGRPAGWYSDPGHPAFVRWYDGTAWTDRFQPAGNHRNAGQGMQQSY